MEDLDAFKKSIRIMCTNLAGQTVVINWRAPIVIGLVGQAYISAKGVITFDIDPDHPIEGIYLTAIHEAAHCIAGHLDQMPPRDISEDIENLYLNEGPILERTQQENSEYWDDPKEVEARNIASELDNMARNHTSGLLGNDDIERKIIFLSQVRILRPEEKSDGEKNA